MSPVEVEINGGNSAVARGREKNIDETKQSRIRRIGGWKVSICLASETSDKLSDSCGGILQKND